MNQFPSLDSSARPPAAGPALASAVAALITYAVTLNGTLIYDDFEIASDPRYSDPHQWLKFLTESYNYGVDNLYRPLVSLSYAVQWQVSKNPIPLHLVNWLMHAAVCAMVATLAVRLTRSSAAGYCSGLLFAILPIHVEAVANIVGRAELMCAMGVVGGLVVMLHRPMTIRRALAAVGCLILAMGSKEQGLLLPLLAGLMAVCLGIRRPVDEDERQGMLWLILLNCFCTAGFVLYRESFLKFGWYREGLDWVQQPLIRSVGPDRLLMPIALLGRYVTVLLWPAQLSIDYGSHVIGWHVRSGDPYLAVGIIVIVAWCVALFHFWRSRSGSALFCLLAATAIYLMISNFVVLIGTIFGERLMYLPSVFLCILAGLVAIRLPRPIMIATLAVVILLGGVRSALYARQWNHRLDFYEAQSAQQPRSVKLDLLVADEMLKAGNLTEAAKADKRARDVGPDYWDAWLHSGKVAMAGGRFDEADGYFQKAMLIRPGLQTAAWFMKLNEARAATRPISSTLPSPIPTAMPQ